mmetsp:Transcript_98613/g.274483  ORF Transcript_98613/g.274483 Transcript_98613/m.274483 type:complete len:240 (+) Transcript_98613:361-1080(+)
MTSKLCCDAREVVMPGVHQRLNATAVELGVLRREVSHGFLQQKHFFESAIDAFCVHLSGILGEASISMLHGTHSSVAAPSLRSPLRIQTTTGTTSIATRTPPNNTTIQQTIQQNGDFYCLSPKYQTVHQLWNEWFGLGAFQGKPVPGGFAALEEEQGTKWRKQFDAAQKAQISRVKRTIKGIEDLSKHPSMDLQQALWSWNKIYVEDCNKSLSRFVMTISSRGGMSKRKSRGRHQKISE